MKISNRQAGASPVVSIIGLVVLGYGVFVGIQYVPQWLEARAVDSILDSIRQSQATEPIASARDARDKVVRLLQVNDMDAMTEKFDVTRTGSGVDISFHWRRELNLVYEERIMDYRRSLRVDFPR